MTEEHTITTYALTEHNGYWASGMQADMAKGRTAQQACNDTFKAILMMGRGKDEALRVTIEAAYFAGIPAESVNW